MSIPSEQVQQIKALNDIVDVIGQYVELKRSAPASPIYVGQCPFHKEKDGSFKVNQQTQSYYCYGCGHGSKQNGSGSDVIAFVQDIEEVEFNEACRILGERVGIEVTNEKPDPAIENAKKLATSHNRRYYSNLWDPNNQEGVKALTYLRDRGLTDQTIQDWRLGLVPSNELNHRTDITQIAGKIVFPIIEPGKSDPKKAQTLGMAYREPVDHPPQPKYKNDPTSPAFNKGQLLYGLHAAFPEIRTKKCGIMLECYFGTMMLHQYGIKNAVASMGTMISESQLMLARRFARKWIFMYDGDKAGFDATVRALPMMLKLNMDPWFAPLPEGEDPDEFIMRIGTDKFKAWLEKSAVPLLEFLVQKRLGEFETIVNSLKMEVLDGLDPILQYVSGSKKTVLDALIHQRLGI